MNGLYLFLSPNKLINDDLTLNCLDISEASKIKTRKSQGLLLSCNQVNSSRWQINVAITVGEILTWSVTETVIVVVAGYADDQLRNDLKNCNFDYDVCYVDV